MRLRFHVAATLLLLTLALAELATASPSFSRVALLLPACEAPGLSASELRQAVALDLRDESLTLAPAGELSPASDVLLRIESGCAEDSELTLYAQFADELHTRRVDLGELQPSQRARALSLAVAELLARFGQAPPPSTTDGAGDEGPALPSAARAPSSPAASITPGAAPPPRPMPVPAAPKERSAPAKERSAAAPGPSETPADRRATSSLSRQWRLSLSPQLRFFDTTWLWGGRALLHYGAWSGGLDLLKAHDRAQPGSVSTLIVHGSVGYSFVLTGGADSSRLEGGPRLGAGRTFMVARATGAARAYDAEDVYLDAALGTRYSLRISPLFRIALGGELGYASGPVGYADGLEVARTSGAFASLFVQASLAFRQP